MASREETAKVLSRHADELHEAWCSNPSELSALLTYIAHISDAEKWRRDIEKRDASSLLLFFGGRIPEQGINQLLQVFHDTINKTSCFIAESPISCKLNPIPFNAREFAETLKLRGWQGPLSFNNTAQNTGDQASALVEHLVNLPSKPLTLVIAASVDHIGRMTATTIDALETHDLLKDLQVIPLALGEWSDIHMENFTCEDLAFGSEHTSAGKATRSPETETLQRLLGQYTFRWQRALEAKKKGEFLGRAIVEPSHALEVLGWGSGNEHS